VSLATNQDMDPTDLTALEDQRDRRPAVPFRTKLLLGHGATLLVSALLVVWSILGFDELGQASSAILSENYRSIAATAAMTAAITHQERELMLLATGRELEAGARQFHEGEARFVRALGGARDNITIDGEEAILDTIQARYTQFLVVASRQMRATDLVAARTGFETEVAPAADSVRNACDHLRGVNEQTMYEASGAAALMARHAIWTMAATGAALVCLGLVIALLLSRRAVLPLQRLLAATTTVAAGDYRVLVPVTTSDEIGALTGAFNRMVSRLASYDDRNIQRLVSEQQKSEAILRSLDDGVVVLDEMNMVSAINPAAARFLGVSPSEAVGKHFLEVHRDEQLFELVTRPPVDGRPRVSSDDVIPLGGDGDARYCAVSVTPIESPRGGSPGKVLLLRDVTRFEQLDRLKSDFVSTASHELRGPLTSVAMSVSLLRESVGPRLDPKERSLVAAAEEDIARLRALVQDLLDLSRIESGRVELSFVPMAPSAVIERVVGIFEPQARQAKIELRSTFPDTLPEVRVDATKITWVLSNLVSNALRYTSAGGFIAIAAVPAGRHVHVSVTDSGVGIPREAQGRVFDKFVRVGPDRAEGGTGLGLAICKEIVRAHGGSIWVESEPGKGSTFTFTIPAVAQGEHR
jgi:NtrC-family two-component system sensor histidine kinase KinB